MSTFLGKTVSSWHFSKKWRYFSVIFLIVLNNDVIIIYSLVSFWIVLYHIFQIGLSSLDKKLISFRSKWYEPFLEFRRTLLYFSLEKCLKHALFVFRSVQLILVFVINFFPQMKPRKQLPKTSTQGSTNLLGSDWKARSFLVTWKTFREILICSVNLRFLK